jgi:alpha-ribazole phosphatase
MKIYFIRHAESKFNLKEIACNNQEKNILTRVGKKQAEKLAKKLININIDKIFISEAKRAYETILPLIKVRKDIPVKKDKRLNECSFGIFGGLSLGAAEKKYPKIFKAKQIDQWNIPAPNGESYRDVFLRFKLFLNDLKKDAKKSRLENIVIISHATPLKVFLVKYLGFSLKKVESIYFKNALISIFDFQNGKIKPIQINGRFYIKEN